MAYEMGYRAILTNRLSVDLAAYFNSYHDLETTEPSTPFFENTPSPPHFVQPFMYENMMHGETHGVEIAGNWKLTDRWTVASWYALEQIHLHLAPTSGDTQTVPFTEGAVPRHTANTRSHGDLRKFLAWDTTASFSDRLVNQGISGDVKIPAYTRLDTGLTWNLRRGFSIGLEGQNLLKDHHPRI